MPSTRSPRRALAVAVALLALTAATGQSDVGGATGGVITDREFATWIDWLADAGELKGPRPKPADLYTNRFNAFANPGGGA
ncbi:hypothetical protein [Micromonospora sp. RP3T]|uniref:hypothetical protein n=1 Tax=Micromonospora sp. RP3T TaxID=2135446 RepID=UPI003D75E9F6